MAADRFWELSDNSREDPSFHGGVAVRSSKEQRQKQKEVPEQNTLQASGLRFGGGSNLETFTSPSFSPFLSLPPPFIFSKIPPPHPPGHTHRIKPEDEKLLSCYYPSYRKMRCKS